MAKRRAGVTGGRGTGDRDGGLVIGRLTRAEHDAWIRDVEEWEAFALGQLSTKFSEMFGYWRIWGADHDDPRNDEERKWRANIHPPNLFVNSETRTAIINDIINSVDPVIQSEGRNEEDIEGADSIEKYLKYVLDANRWQGVFLMEAIRVASVQGMDFMSVAHIHKEYAVRVIPTSAQKDDFQKALIDARNAGAIEFPDPEIDPVSFDAWRETVNDAYGPTIKVPKPPYSGQQRMIKYRGADLRRVPVFEMRWDPMTVWEMQPRILRRVVKPRAWVNARTGDEPRYPFDPDQVDQARSGGDTKRFTDYEEQFATILGVVPTASADPFYRTADEIWEVWEPEGDKVKYAVVLNRKQIINKKCYQTPFIDGETHIHPIFNLVVPGMSMGMSEYKQPKSVYDEHMKYRNLVQDAATLGVIPVLQMLRELGVGDLQRRIAPGNIWKVPKESAVKRLYEIGLPAEFKSVLGLGPAEMDEASSIYSNVKGQPATVGRVPATESTSRTNSALTRLKLGAVLYESCLQNAVPQILSVAYQYGPPEVIEEVGKGNPLLKLDPERFLEALGENYRFSGATRALSRELLAQQTMQFGEKFAQQLTAAEVRATMKEIADLLGLRRKGSIVSADGTKKAVEAWEKQRTLAMVNLDKQLQAATMQPAPAEVDPATAAAAVQEGGSLPPGPEPPAGGGAPGGGGPAMGGGAQ